jgi:hypothetical protein
MKVAHFFDLLVSCFFSSASSSFSGELEEDTLSYFSLNLEVGSFIIPKTPWPVSLIIFVAAYVVCIKVSVAMSAVLRIPSVALSPEFKIAFVAEPQRSSSGMKPVCSLPNSMNASYS